MLELLPDLLVSMIAEVAFDVPNFPISTVDSREIRSCWSVGYTHGTWIWSESPRFSRLDVLDVIDLLDLLDLLDQWGIRRRSLDLLFHWEDQPFLLFCHFAPLLGFLNAVPCQ